jgi:hypothetical protein
LELEFPLHVEHLGFPVGLAYSEQRLILELLKRSLFLWTACESSTRKTSLGLLPGDFLLPSDGGNLLLS